jgi:hypothetical protein
MLVGKSEELRQLMEENDGATRGIEQASPVKGLLFPSS